MEFQKNLNRGDAEGTEDKDFKELSTHRAKRAKRWSLRKILTAEMRRARRVRIYKKP
jgi:hypothetical protein